MLQSFMLTNSDFNQIAILHKNYLTDFLSQCNISFIRSFYSYINNLESTILEVIKEENRVLGFAFFTTDKNTYFSSFIKNRLFAFFLNYSVFFPLLKAIILTKKQHFNYDVELVEIAVDKSYRMRGIATKLINNAEKILLDKNIKEYYVQIYKENIDALRFYDKLGFSFQDEFVLRGKLKILMKKEIYE